MRAVKGSLGHSLESELGKLGRIIYIVGRAQWKINQPPSLERERASLVGSLTGLVRWDGAENFELIFGSTEVQDSGDGAYARRVPAPRASD
jgi:hypothetical protein